MSMASPTLRSSSSTLPELSCSSWATDMVERPSTAEIETGTSNTGARSVALFSSPAPIRSGRPPAPPKSSSFRSSSLAMGSASRRRDQGFGVQAFGGQGGGQRRLHALGGGGGIEGRGAVAEVQGEG